VPKVSKSKDKACWYIGGLHFECQKCGRCCSGPNEGYIWITKPEIKLVADFLKMPAGRLREKFLRRVGLRTTIIEQTGSKDCIFLREGDSGRECMIYPVRPSQCRSWPFWTSNLASANSWNKSAQLCAGINRGRCYSFEQVQRIKKEKKWWASGRQIDTY